MSDSYEDPRKSGLRRRLLEALDRSGHDIVDPPEQFPYPPKSGLHGTLIGDAQTRAPNGVVDLYFVRSTIDKAMPGWLINSIRVGRTITATRCHVVVTETAQPFQRACKMAGAGLLLLTDDNDLVEVHKPPVGDLLDDAGCKERAKSLRAQVIQRHALNKSNLEKRYADADTITKQMSGPQRAKYLQPIENGVNRWSEWAERVGSMVDTAMLSCDDADFRVAERAIARGIESSANE